MEAVPSGAVWEAMYAPYDRQTYQAVLDQLRPDDIVLDIGAGDLRLARQMARTVHKVYAVEVNAQVMERSHPRSEPLPVNLTVICADARTLDFPPDVTTGVLLMRHCTCFPLYVDKLRDAGATRLITNARWRMSVEVVDLEPEPMPYAEAPIGWYACGCGRVGFKEGPVEHWTTQMDQISSEVSSCPHCL